MKAGEIVRLVLLCSFTFLISGYSYAKQIVNAADTVSIDSASVSDTVGYLHFPETGNMKGLKEQIAFYLYWEDQFPSPIIQFSYGAPPEKQYEIPRKEQGNNWQFFLAFLLLALLALIRYGYGKEFEELLTVFNNWGPSQQMYRELGTGVSFGTVLLNFFSAIVLSLYVFLLLNMYGNLQIAPVWLMMLSATMGVTVLLISRYLFLKLASVLLPFRKEITLFNFYEIQINRLLGVFLFPLVLMITFSDEPFKAYSLYASFGVVGFFILIRYVKGFNIGVNYFGRHLFHFLLYICALEVAPVLIIIRLLLNLGPLRFSF